MSDTCAVDGCDADWEEWATARGEQHGLPAKLVVPVCAEHLDEFGGNAEPLTFDAEEGCGDE